MSRALQVGRTSISYVFLVLTTLLPLSVIKVSAATPGSLYSYDFRGTSLTTPLPNQAATNGSVGLNLYGNWAKSDFGIHFDGDQSSKISVAYAKPASGNTIAVPANQALGGTVLFRYTGPSPGGGCVGDSRNIAQIGRSGANVAQIKFQFSNCGTSNKNVYQECRIAGAKSAANVAVARSSQALITGATYLAQCVKSPDPASGNTTIQLTTTRVDVTNGNFVTIDTMQIPPPGALTSTAYLSVGNKYKLPPISQNTDQFVGDIAKVAFCSGGSVAVTFNCLSNEIPTPTTPVITTQDVTTTTGVPFQQRSVDDPSIPAGTSEIVQQGVDGVETTVYTVTYTDGVETNRVLKSDTVTTQPIDQITNVGTGLSSDPIITTQEETETVSVPFQSIAVDDPALPVGTSQVTQQGVNGVETIVYTVTYTDGVETNRVISSDSVTTAPISQIASVGTKQAPTVQEYVTNQSVETSNAGWTGLLNSSCKAIRITTDAHDGRASLEVSRTANGTGSAGVSAKPALVTSTVAGSDFTGSVWVRAQAPGQTITLQLKETNASGAIVGSKSVSYTAPDLVWHQITTNYTTIGSGNQLGFVVSSPRMSVSDWFHVDSMSLLGQK